MIEHLHESSLTTKSCRFRWVQCQVESIREKNTVKEIREALERVPKTLFESYKETLNQIPENLVDLARNTLYWVAIAGKPLTLNELAEAVLIDEESAVINDDVRLLQKDIIVSTCGRLLSYDPSTTIITLLHSSVFQFLLSADLARSEASRFGLHPAHLLDPMARRCMNYMMLPAFASGSCPESSSLSNRMNEWPLLHYLTTALIDFIGFIKIDGKMHSILKAFLDSHKSPRGGNFGAWLQATFPARYKASDRSIPLYLAARWGWLGFVETILLVEGRENIETPCGRYSSTPLHLAAYYGHTSVVAKLLDHGANAGETNDNGESGLFWAKVIGYADVESLLQEALAKLDVSVSRRPTNIPSRESATPSSDNP